MQTNITDEKPARTSIRKRKDGSFIDYSMMSCTMFWDEHGAYLGQEQPNMLDDETATIWLPATGNEAGQFGLTQEEMNNAIPVKQRNK